MGKFAIYRSKEVVGECYFLQNEGVLKNFKMALFQCGMCGEEFITKISVARYASILPCGCLTKINGKLHGEKIRRSWLSMKQRCLSINNYSYHNYGARGIIVCDEWKNDFKAFYDHITGLERYGEPGMTLDRKNNNGNYEPGNMRWATRHEQNLNKRLQKNNKTGFNGVSLDSNLYASNITIHKKRITIGYFKTIKEAVIERNNYILQHNLTEYEIQTYHGA